jgi:hypothetical protein
MTNPSTGLLNITADAIYLIQNGVPVDITTIIASGGGGGAYTIAQTDALLLAKEDELDANSSIVLKSLGIGSAGTAPTDGIDIGPVTIRADGNWAGTSQNLIVFKSAPGAEEHRIVGKTGAGGSDNALQFQVHSFWSGGSAGLAIPLSLYGDNSATFGGNVTIPNALATTATIGDISFTAGTAKASGTLVLAGNSIRIDNANGTNISKFQNGAIQLNKDTFVSGNLS